MNYDLQYVAALIPAIQSHEYGALCRYYAKLPRLAQIDAHRLHTAIMRTRSGERQEGKQAEYVYATFLQTVAQIRKTEKAADNSQLLTEREALRVAELRSARVDGRKKSKAAPAKAKIQKKYLLLIQQMRSSGKSWRDIAYYLKTYHRQRLSYSYLRRVFLDSQDQG